MGQMVERPDTPATNERGWFLLHLGRLSSMNDMMLEKAKAADEEPDAKKAANMLEELEEMAKKYVSNAASLQAYAMTWKRAAKTEAKKVECLSS